MRRALCLLLVVLIGSALVPLVAPADTTTYLTTPISLCAHQDADYDKTNGTAASEYPECLYQPADGSVAAEPSTVKVGDTTTVTWTSGTYTGTSGTATTVPDWWDSSSVGFFATRVSPTGNPQNDNRVYLEPVDSTACRHAYTCVMRVEPYSTYPIGDGYYRLAATYGLLNGLGGLSSVEPDDRVAHYDIQLHVARNQSPNAAFTITKLGPMTYSLDASSSFDPDGSITSYQWMYTGDSPTPDDQTGQKVTVTFSHAGAFDVRLQIADDDGEPGFAKQTIHVLPADTTPTPTATVDPTPAATADPTATATATAGPTASATPTTTAAPTATPVVTATPPAGSGLTHVAGSVTVWTAKTIALARASNPPLSKVSAELTVPAASGHVRSAKRTVVARGAVSVPAGTTRTVAAKLTHAGRKIVRKHKHVQVRLTIVTTGTNGARQTTTRALAVNR